ncbi:hypothetical protein ACFE04_005532 [Oxalis oulophora]
MLRMPHLQPHQMFHIQRGFKLLARSSVLEFPSFVVIGQFISQFAYLEENGGRNVPIIRPEREHEIAKDVVLILIMHKVLRTSGLCKRIETLFQGSCKSTM